MLTLAVMVGIIVVVVTGMTSLGYFMRASEARRNGEPDVKKYVWYGVLFSLPAFLIVVAASAAPGIIMMQHRHH